VAQSSVPVFLDASSAEPLLPEAREAWLAAQDAGWGDPLRLHRAGRRAAQALDRTRAVVADAVGARPDEVVFTGSGPHSAQAAIAGLALGRRRVGAGIVTSAVEHSSVLSAAERYGDAVTVPVDLLGRVDLGAWRAAVSADGVALAGLQVGNHEVGTLQPFREAAEACRAADVPFVLDATSALGRTDLREAGDWSVLLGSAAAFGGPPSVGLLVIRKGARWRAPYPTDDYQGGRWPGLPDVPAIFAAAVALETWLADYDEVSARQHQLVGSLRRGLPRAVPDIDVAGDPDLRLPHLLTFSALYVDGESLTLELDRAGFAVASGSACSASNEHPSHVLAAMGALTHGNVRLGLTRTTTKADVESFLLAVPPVVEELRARLGAP
jgi:cysteine desulfurase